MVEEMPGGFDGQKVLENTAISAIIQFAAGVPTIGNEAYGVDTTYSPV